MATKQFYATRDFKYGTRMLRAGDPVELDGPNARLFAALNAISEEKPKSVRAPAAKAEAPPPVPNPPVHHGALPDPRTGTAYAPKPARKRKAAAKKK